MSWLRTSPRRRCSICGHDSWCSITTDGRVVVCMRIPSERPARNGGWVHQLGHGQATAPVRVEKQPPRPPSAYFETLAAKCEANGTARLPGLGGKLGVTVESLQRINTGWSGQHAAFTFPMRDAVGRVVGVRLRLPGGRKLSVRGGHEGLFCPADLPANLAGSVLLLPEGASDTAAALAMGFLAVGRPSCTGGTRHITELVKRHRPDEVVLVADEDEAGQRGAAALASTMLVFCAEVRMITPPTPHKDLRQWKVNGATPADLQRLIDAAPARRLRIQKPRQARTA